MAAKTGVETERDAFKKRIVALELRIKGLTKSSGDSKSSPKPQKKDATNMSAQTKEIAFNDKYFNNSKPCNERSITADSLPVPQKASFL